MGFSKMCGARPSFKVLAMQSPAGRKVGGLGPRRKTGGGGNSGYPKKVCLSGIGSSRQT